MTDQFEYAVKLVRDKSDELYSDILDLFMDCMEAGYSTFQYTGHVKNGAGTTTGVQVKDPEDGGKQYLADRETVHKGLCAMLADDGTPKPGPGNMAQSYVPSIDSQYVAPARRVALGLITGEYDAGTIDVGDADCIVQLGLLGEVRYG